MPRIRLVHVHNINLVIFYFNTNTHIWILSFISTNYSLTCISSDNALFDLGCKTFFG